jgi:hypothetical protein
MSKNIKYYYFIQKKVFNPNIYQKNLLFAGEIIVIAILTNYTKQRYVYNRTTIIKGNVL